MKKVSKILCFVLVLFLALAPTAISMAVPANFTENTGITDKMGGLETAIGSVITVLKWIGYAIAVIMVLWLGVQWMLAQPAKKAELKGKMWSIAIGIILLVGGVTILDIVWGLAENSGLSSSL